MLIQTKQTRQTWEWGLWVPTIGLLAIGLLNLTSVATPNDVQKQGLGIVLSAVSVAIIGRMGRLGIDRWTWPFYGCALCLLTLTAFFGREINGSRNWLVVGPVQFQPLELAKVALVVSLGRVMRLGYQNARSYLPVMLLALPIIALVAREDLGGALVVSAMVVTLMWVWGMPIWHIAIGILVVGIALPTLIYPNLKPYQQTRLTIFLDPTKDALGSGYQIQQSLVAIGSGGWFGKGYRKGSQIRGGFVPEQHTDFAISGWAEEWGFLGIGVLLTLYGCLFWRLTVLALHMERRQDQLIAMGILGQIGFQVFENIGASLSLLPLTGITLPFVSYGSSSLISLTSSLGIVYVLYRDQGTNVPEHAYGRFQK